MQEYREHKDKIERDEVRAELDKAAKKAKLTEITALKLAKLFSVEKSRFHRRIGRTSPTLQRKRSLH